MKEKKSVYKDEKKIFQRKIRHWQIDCKIFYGPFTCACAQKLTKPAQISAQKFIFSCAKFCLKISFLTQIFYTKSLSDFKNSCGIRFRTLNSIR